jgi:hypothetical protein
MTENKNIFNSYDNFKKDLLAVILDPSAYTLQTQEDNRELFKFSKMTEQNIRQSSEITDYRMEDNALLSDHIADSPIEITLSGLVAMYVDEPPAQLKYQAEIQERLNAFGGITRLLGVGDNLSRKAQEFYTKAKQTKEKAEELANKIDDGAGFLKTLAGLSNNNPYISCYQILSALRKNRILLKVNTDFSVLNNMVIKDFFCSKDGDVDNAKVSVTLKQINYAIVKIKSKSYIKGQKAPATNQGVKQKNESILNKVKNFFKIKL